MFPAKPSRRLFLRGLGVSLALPWLESVSVWGAEAAKAKLGKVSVGKVCIRFKKLADLNLPAALELVREASALLDNGSTNFSL